MGTIEDRNYWHDRRVKVRPHQHEAWKTDTGRKVVIIELPDFCWAHGEGDHDEHPECPVCRKVAIVEHATEAARARGEREVDVPEGTTELVVGFEWQICGTCEGDGTHVNPSIDCGGLTREDFDADPDFEESYRSGAYDVTCSECGGSGKTPKLTPRTADERAIVAGLEKQEADEASYERECRAERAMGA